MRLIASLAAPLRSSRRFGARPKPYAQLPAGVAVGHELKKIKEKTASTAGRHKKRAVARRQLVAEKGSPCRSDLPRGLRHTGEEGRRDRAVQGPRTREFPRAQGPEAIGSDHSGRRLMVNVDG